ncbi:MAG: T9SS type A sorting domain-containing protein [Chitinophagaceae bacterium]|nr:T9SS type A sorting domain-containing protein [Chitinophagaceae bacterium]
MSSGITLVQFLYPKHLSIGVRTGLLLTVLSFSSTSFSQNISGIVNTYHRVIEVIPAMACVRVNPVGSLSYNDKVMLIQMKGASINTSDPTSATFGDTTSLNNAGNYEIATVCYISGDTVFLVFNILNAYTVADKVQLVKMPHYYNATVIDTLKAAPWNNTTGTGGVLAIYVDQDLVMNAPISADTIGFRGGGFRLSNSSCSNGAGANSYAYNGSSSSPQNGAFKGEGVADVISTQSGGRGAPANGGGGGNNHNNGGAGGANLSMGGDGGGNSSSGAFNCTLSRFGRGGKALSTHGGKKIFLGGGGGAGHVNNGFAVSNGGGHGGGILFIRATTVTGNGHRISANGQVGGPAASDGASGAGAGGTIIMHVTTYTGSLVVQANGAQGGTEADGGNINYCYGAGGGGSGGVINFSAAIPGAPVTATANGGAAGLETGRDVSCAAAVLPQAGGAGQVNANYTYRNSNVLVSSYCSALLPVELVSFRAIYSGGKTKMTWEVNQPEQIRHFTIQRFNSGNNWIDINAQASEDNRHSYVDIDHSPQIGYNLYRVRISKKNNAVAYSEVQKVLVQSMDNINIYPNPASGQIFVSGISGHSRLELFDISGKFIWRKAVVANQAPLSIELPALAPGVYVMNVNGISKRLIIH